MKLILATPGITTKERKTVEYHLNKILPSIKKRLGRHAPGVTIFRARLTSDGSVDRPMYHLTISFQLPDQTVVVHKDNHDLNSLMNSVESALKKELRRSVAKVRKDYLNRRRRSTQEMFQNFADDLVKSPGLSQAQSLNLEPESHPLFARMRPLMSSLYNFARDHIHAAQVAGELPADYLTPDDLVDQAILGALEANGSVMADPKTLEQVLYRQIEMMLADEVSRHRPDDSEMISIEQGAPEDERWGINGTEMEEREYFQPFTALRMEDVLIDDHAEDPDHHMTDVEEHRIILKYLSNFPSKARSAFFLNRVEGFDVYEIAMIQNRSDDSVQQDINECVKALQEGWSKLHGTNGVAHGAVKSESASA